MTALSAERKTVVGLLKAYYDAYTLGTGSAPVIIDLASTPDTVTESTIDTLMHDIKRKLHRRIESAASVALACVPELYEYAALVIADTTPYPKGMSKLSRDDFAKRVTELHGRKKIQPKCLLKSCLDHDGRKLIAAPKRAEGSAKSEADGSAARKRPKASDQPKSRDQPKAREAKGGWCTIQ